MLGLLYGLLSLVIVPFFLLAALSGSRANAPGTWEKGLVILLPVVYAVAGFIGGIV